MRADLETVTIGIYLSSDGATPEALLLSYSVTDPDDLEVGTGHEVPITPDFLDIHALLPRR